MNAGTLVKKLKLMNPEVEVVFTDPDGAVYPINMVTVDMVVDLTDDKEKECIILRGFVTEDYVPFVT